MFGDALFALVGGVVGVFGGGWEGGLGMLDLGGVKGERIKGVPFLL